MKTKTLELQAGGFVTVGQSNIIIEDSVGIHKLPNEVALVFVKDGIETMFPLTNKDAYKIAELLLKTANKNIKEYIKNAAKES